MWFGLIESARGYFSLKRFIVNLLSLSKKRGGEATPSLKAP